MKTLVLKGQIIIHATKYMVKRVQSVNPQTIRICMCSCCTDLGHTGHPIKYPIQDAVGSSPTAQDTRSCWHQHLSIQIIVQGFFYTYFNLGVVSITMWRIKTNFQGVTHLVITIYTGSSIQRCASGPRDGTALLVKQLTQHCTVLPATIFPYTITLSFWRQNYTFA